MKSMIVLCAVAALALGEPQWQNQVQSQYQGPVALPPGYDKNGAPLPVQDTPEVAALKASQLSTLAGAGGHVPNQAWNAQPAQTWNAQPAQNWNAQPAQTWNAQPAQTWNAQPAQNWNAQPAQTWNAQPAQTWNAAPVAQTQWAAAPGNNNPLWNANALPAGVQHSANQVGQGLPADTPEVAAAKAAHLAAHAAAGTHGRWRRSAVLAVPYTSFPGSTGPLVHSLPLVHHTPLIRSHIVPLHSAHWW